MKTYLKGFMFIFILIIVDQVTKHYFKASYTGVDTVFIRGLIEFSYAENTGMSFGLLKGQTFFFMIITVLALGLFGYLYLDINFFFPDKYFSLSSNASTSIVANFCVTVIDASFRSPTYLFNF
jgi:hypothetical protein